MSKSITAIEFLNIWNEFISELTTIPEWEEVYKSNSRWTSYVIGSKHSNETESPLGKKLKEKKDFRYRTEDGLTDLSVAKINSFKNIKSLHIEGNSYVINDNHFYPEHYEILIEHENNIYFCYEEIAKLTYAKSRLKVLITYNEDLTKKDDFSYISNQVRDNFSEIIKQANSSFPENIDTEYLLLIGQKKENNLVFSNYIFDTKGITKD